MRCSEVPSSAASAATTDTLCTATCPVGTWRGLEGGREGERGGGKEGGKRREVEGKRKREAGEEGRGERGS